MAFSLKTYEDQAKFSVVLGAVATVAIVAALGLILQRFDWSAFMIPIKSKLRLVAILGGIGVAGLLSTAGFFVSLNTAGQKRNKNQSLSWTGFFFNAAILTLAACVGVVFMLTKISVS
ncbi:MAG: hypothetical protein JNG88_01100 [Phycisphaerales bacterium]|nr:hypothetical protein [Phycisphaerales bacterium]